MATNENQPEVFCTSKNEFLDISEKQDGILFKKLIQAGQVLESCNHGDVAQFYLFLVDEKEQTVLGKKLRVSFCVINNDSNDIIQMAIKSMAKGEIADFKFEEDLEQENGKWKIIRIEMLGYICEDISKNKDHSLLRYLIKEGEGTSSPNDGALVQCHLAASLLDGSKFDERDVTFSIGEGSESDLPRGVEIALTHMKLFEKSRFVIKQPFTSIPASLKDQFEELPDLLIYEIRLNNFNRAKEVWEMDNEERLETAKKHKEKGTEYFKQKKLEIAAKFYSKVVYLLGPPESVSYKDMNEERNEILLAGYLNLAQTYLKLDHPFKVIKNCDLALQLDEKNVKAHFRKGLAYIETKEFDLAVQQFERCLQIDANNRAIMKEYTRARQLLKSNLQKEKFTFANMFERFAKIDKERERQQLAAGEEVWKKLSEESEFQSGSSFSDIPVKMI